MKAREQSMDAYLRVAAGLGAPAVSRLAQAEQPMVALREHLGVKEGEVLVADFDFGGRSLTCELFVDVAPVTVANFVGLARGTQRWHDPRTGREGSGSLYVGTPLHRVIPDFMIQGGDPLGRALAVPATSSTTRCATTCASTDPADSPWPTRVLVPTGRSSS